jgi:hypothetical protein
MVRGFCFAILIVFLVFLSVCGGGALTGIAGIGALVAFCWFVYLAIQESKASQVSKDESAESDAAKKSKPKSLFD